jgi:carboxylesterase
VPSVPRAEWTQARIAPVEPAPRWDQPAAEEVVPVAAPPERTPDDDPFSADGGPVGVVVSHGFTGTPASMRPWAEHLAAAGCTVRLPLLPGHGQSWRETNRTSWPQWYAAIESAYLELRDRLDARLAPFISWAVRSRPAIGGDIKKPGVDESAADRTPVVAFASLQKLWKVTAADLGRVRAPILLYRSREDHVVDDLSGQLLRSGAINTVVREVVLENSYHVATLDHDAPLIFDGSVEFIRSLTGPLQVGESGAAP